MSTTTSGTSSRVPTTGRQTSVRGLRSGATLLLAGLVAEYGVTLLHPSHEAPDDHPAAFAEYAASRDWLAVHLLQFATAVVALLGVLVLLQALRAAGAPPLLVRVGSASAAVAVAVLAVLQGVDGVALGRAVDAWSAAPPDQRDAAYSAAVTVRWIEESVAAYAQVTLGLTVLTLGSAVLASRGLPRWTGVPAVLSGAAFVTQGVQVGYEGFSAAAAATVAALLLVAFALSATVAAWLPRSGRTTAPSGPVAGDPPAGGPR